MISGRQDGRPPRAAIWGCGAVAAGVAGYLVARAVWVPMTYDEAAAYYRYVAGAPSALFDFATATNHFLSSVLIRAAHGALGAEPWALRLPGVVAGVAFLGCAAAFAARARHAAIGVAGFVLLATNPYVLDYLALSRGYGLSMALLTASAYLFVRWCEDAAAPEAARRRLAWSLGLAGAAVAASYSALPAFMAMVAVAAARLGWSARQDPAAIAARRRTMMPPWRHVTGWVLVTAAFSAMVYSRERAFSPQAFVPVEVRVSGLFRDELSAISAFRIDATGRPRKLGAAPGGVWQLGPAQDAWDTVMVGLPAAADRNLARLDLRVGDEVFRRDRRHGGPWTHVDVGGDRVLVTTTAVGWRPDAAHLRQALRWAAATVAALLALGGALVLLATALVRRGVLAPEDARILLGAVLPVASLAAAPLILLQRAGELFFGGTTGLVADTFGSLVLGSAYGAVYHPNQVAWTLVAGGLVAAGLPLVLLASARARREPAFSGPAALLAVIALACAQVVLQHHVAGTPYPLARTALFLLPLMLIVIGLAADAVATLGRLPRLAATTVLVLAAAASAAHLVRVANVTHTLDWPEDASTAGMLARVAGTGAVDATSAGVMRVGVEWMFYPVARFYAERQSSRGTRYVVTVLPEDPRQVDFVYARRRSGLGQGRELQRFPQNDAVLWQVRDGGQ